MQGWRLSSFLGHSEALCSFAPRWEHSGLGTFSPGLVQTTKVNTLETCQVLEVHEEGEFEARAAEDVTPKSAVWIT